MPFPLQNKLSSFVRLNENSILCKTGSEDIPHLNYAIFTYVLGKYRIVNLYLKYHGRAVLGQYQGMFSIVTMDADTQQYQLLSNEHVPNKFNCTVEQEEII